MAGTLLLKANPSDHQAVSWIDIVGFCEQAKVEVELLRSADHCPERAGNLLLNVPRLVSEPPEDELTQVNHQLVASRIGEVVPFIVTGISRRRLGYRSSPTPWNHEGSVDLGVIPTLSSLGVRSHLVTGQLNWIGGATSWRRSGFGVVGLSARARARSLHSWSAVC